MQTNEPDSNDERHDKPLDQETKPVPYESVARGVLFVLVAGVILAISGGLFFTFLIGHAYGNTSVFLFLIPIAALILLVLAAYFIFAE